MNQQIGKSSHSERDDEEGEALSLCDLPIKILRKHDESVKNGSDKEEPKYHKDNEILGEEEFNFIGPPSFESEMCIADEIFFQGQILPLQRLSSVSSDGPISRQQHQACCTSSGEYYYSTSRSTSSSSRSNISSRSNSVNSTISSTVTTTNYTNKAKSKVINQFHTHPSPKPQINKLSSLRPGPATATGINARRQNSSVWEFLRVGLVRTPEIELHNLKLRTNKKNTTSVYVGSGNSNSNGNSSSSSRSSLKNNDSKLNKHIKRLDVSSASILSGCGGKCAIDVVEKTVASGSRKAVLLKSKSSGSRIGTEDTMKEKLLQHHNSSDRTFEWLKQLSVENTKECL